MLKRFMVIKTNGNIAFTKITVNDGESETQTIREYSKETQTELDFAQEAQTRLDNEFPEWADVLEWERIPEEDLSEWLADMENVTI